MKEAYESPEMEIIEIDGGGRHYFHQRRGGPLIDSRSAVFCI